MSDGYVQAPADNTGKLVDATETTNSDGDTVERLRMAVPGQVKISAEALDLLLIEMRATNDLLAQAFGLDIDALRDNDRES